MAALRSDKRCNGPLTPTLDDAIVARRCCAQHIDWLAWAREALTRTLFMQKFSFEVLFQDVSADQTRVQQPRRSNLNSCRHTTYFPLHTGRMPTFRSV